MEERNLLSSYEEAILYEPNTLVDSVRRKRIIEKVKQSLSTLDKVAGSDKIDFDKLWEYHKILLFLRKLTRHDPSKLPLEENDKLEIAGSLIDIGLDYYSQAFKNSKLYSAKIKDVKDLVHSINEIMQMERIEKTYSKLYAMRKQMRMPPDVRTVGNPTDWKARCDICWNYATGKDKKEAMQRIRHHKYCYYPKYDLEYCIRTFPPRIEN